MVLILTTALSFTQRGHVGLECQHILQCSTHQIHKCLKHFTSLAGLVTRWWICHICIKWNKATAICASANCIVLLDFIVRRRIRMTFSRSITIRCIIIYLRLLAYISWTVKHGEPFSRRRQWMEEAVNITFCLFLSSGKRIFIHYFPKCLRAVVETSIIS